MSEYNFIQLAVTVEIKPLDRTENRFEPVPRVHGDGLRCHGHRFPIKGGISMLEAAVRNANIRMRENINMDLYS